MNREQLREVLIQHSVRWALPDTETAFTGEEWMPRCRTCGRLDPDTETWDHQAEIIAAILAGTRAPKETS